MSSNENQNTVKVTAFKSLRDLIENKETSEIAKNLIVDKNEVAFVSDKLDQSYLNNIINNNVLGSNEVDFSSLPTAQDIREKIIEKRNEENKENDLIISKKFGV